MEHTEHPNKGSIAKTLIVYLGGAWVFIEAINFLIDKYNWNTTILDVLILLVIFGLPAILIYTWFHQEFTRKAIVLQAINGILALTVIGFTLINPGSLNPTQLRLLKFKDNQKKLAESIQSIVILPFDNYTGSDEFEYFVAGIHSGLIGDLGKISVRVLSKTTSRFFKDVDMTIPEIASELGVDAVVEASVSCIEGDSVCIQIILVSAFPEEQQLWVKDFRVAKDQILNFYNEVTKTISEEINIVLTPQEESLLAESRTVDPEAYDAYMKARYYWEQVTPESFQLALEYLNLAMEKDPNWAFPYAGLAEYYMGAKQLGVVPPSFADPIIHENIIKALEMDPNSSYIHYVNAMVAVYAEWNWGKGEKEFLKALEINPNNAICRAYFSHLLVILGRTNEAYEQGKLSLELDPLNPLIQGAFGVVLMDKGDYNEILSLTKKIQNHPVAMFFREASYYAQGDYQNSFKVLMQYLQLFYLDKETIFLIQKTYEKEGYKAALENAVNALEEIAQNSFVLPFDLLWFYRSELNKPEKTLELLEKAFEIRDPSLPYISTNVYAIDYVRDNPRFIKLLKKMNLPPGD